MNNFSLYVFIKVMLIRTKVYNDFQLLTIYARNNSICLTRPKYSSTWWQYWALSRFLSAQGGKSMFGFHYLFRQLWLLFYTLEFLIFICSVQSNSTLPCLGGDVFIVFWTTIYQNTAQTMKFFLKDFFSEWVYLFMITNYTYEFIYFLHLLKKFFMENLCSGLKCFYLLFRTIPKGVFKYLS